MQLRKRLPGSFMASTTNRPSRQSNRSPRLLDRGHGFKGEALKKELPAPRANSKVARERTQPDANSGALHATRTCGTSLQSPDGRSDKGPDACGEEVSRYTRNRAMRMNAPAQVGVQFSALPIGPCCTTASRKGFFGVANFPGKTDVARFVPSPRYSGERVRVRGKTFNPEKRVSEGERFAPHPSPLPGVPGRGNESPDGRFAAPATF